MIIHIGANKTASTTLQRCLFSQSPDIHYMGEDGNNFENHAACLDSMVNADDLFYDHNATRKLFKEFLNSANGKTALFSNEDIMTSRQPTVCAARLKSLVPDAKILLVVRNQLTAIPSWYANHGAFLRNVPRSYWKRYVSLEDWLSFCVNFLDQSPLSGFLYNEVIELYIERFGRENIHVMMFEEFIQDKASFVRQLSNLLNLSDSECLALLDKQHERKRITTRQFRAHQLDEILFCGRKCLREIGIGWLDKKWQKFLSKGSALSIQLNEKWESALCEIYSEGNRKLAETYSLPLEKYNYPL